MQEEDLVWEDPSITTNTFKASFRGFPAGVFGSASPTKLPPTTFSTWLLLSAACPGTAPTPWALTVLAAPDGFVTCGQFSWRQPAGLGKIFRDPE